MPEPRHAIVLAAWQRAKCACFGKVLKNLNSSVVSLVPFSGSFPPIRVSVVSVLRNDVPLLSFKSTFRFHEGMQSVLLRMLQELPRKVWHVCFVFDHAYTLCPSGLAQKGVCTESLFSCIVKLCLWHICVFSRLLSLWFTDYFAELTLGLLKQA